MSGIMANSPYRAVKLQFPVYAVTRDSNPCDIVANAHGVRSDTAEPGERRIRRISLTGRSPVRGFGNPAYLDERGYVWHDKVHNIN